MSGILGIIQDKSEGSSAFEKVYHGLHNLQHRGTQKFVLVTCQDGKFQLEKGDGIIVGRKIDMGHLQSKIAVGVVSDGNNGITELHTAQTRYGQVGVCFDGVISITEASVRSLLSKGAVLGSRNIPELLLHLIALSRKPTLRQAIAEVVAQLNGPFCMLVFTPTSIFAAKDAYGSKPLSIGWSNDGHCVIGSESCAFGISTRPRKIREVNPGEVFEAPSRISSFLASLPVQQACASEFIYATRPDSVLCGQSVEAVRYRMGKILARESPVETDIVSPIPESGTFPSQGFAEALGTKWGFALLRHHYAPRGRFGDSLLARIKLPIVKALVKDRRVCIVDDSMASGVTARQAVISLWNAGASEVHLRIASPLQLRLCPKGFDPPSEHATLLAQNVMIGDMAESFGVNSLAFLSEEGFRNAVRVPLCLLCRK